MSALLLASLLAVAAPLPAAAQEIHAFDVSTPDPASAIRAFGDQAGLQILASAADLKDKKFNPVNGDISTEEALNDLLAGTGLDHRYVGDRAVALVSNSSAGAVASSQTSSTASSASGGQPAPQTNAKSKQEEAKKGFWDRLRLAQVDQGTSSGNTSIEKTAEGSPRRPEKLEEVVVTAQKRSENLMNVPASLTVLSAASLQNQGVVDFSDYKTLVPSLSDFSAGAEGHGAIILRGLNTGYYQFSNTVGYYIDDTPFSATSPLSFGAYLTGDPDLSDIDHLEVLKGPQATLYGASTLGGLIKVVTKKPDLNSDAGEIRLDGSTIDGGGSGYGQAGMLNVVLIPNELALRVSGFDRETPGYMRNATLGTHDQDVSRKEGGKIALRWAPSENLTIDLSAFLQSLRVNGWDYEQVNLQTLAPLAGPYTYALNYDPSFHTTYEVYNATINYKFGSVGTVTNSISYASYGDHEQADYSLYYGGFNASAPAPVPADAAQPLLYSPSLNKFTEELRFTSQRFGAFEWLAGLFYTREQIGFTDYLYNAIPPSLQPIPGPSGTIVSINNPASYKEEAAFTDLTYYFTDAIDLTLGGRYSHNQQGVTDCQTFFTPNAACVANSSSDSDFTYLAALSWRPTQGLNAYARIATSYRPGGPQQNVVPGFPNSFKPDSLTNYEVGLKGAWRDDRLRATIALYDMDWKDVQMSSNIGGFSVISNGGKATVKGIELETQFVPIEHFTLGVNVAFTDAKLDSVSSDVSAFTGAVAGDTLPFTPRWSASVVADYVQPLSGTLTSNLGLTYRYQGSKWSDYPGDPLNTGVVIPYYNTLGMHAGLAWSRYQLQASVGNLFNAHGLDTVVDQRVEGNPPAWAAIIRPRSYTLSFTAKY
jgi:outer membrane receptor protein involved in Fe transport